MLVLILILLGVIVIGVGIIIWGIVQIREDIEYLALSVVINKRVDEYLRGNVEKIKRPLIFNRGSCF